MATTTTRAARGTSPARRPLVWSQNTTYAGAAGVHSEVSRKAHALHVTSQRELNSNLSTIQSLHRKEMQNLRHSRKSLESSMLAYSEKMRRISTDRLQLTDSSGQSSSTLERLLTNSKAANSNSRSRISVDSGIDVEDPPPIEETMTDIPATKGATTIKKSASQPVLHQRRSSVNSLEPLEDSSAAKSSRRRTTNERPNSGKSSSTRQRRAGTTDKPDIFALKLSMSKPSSLGSYDAERAPSAVSSDVSVAITPFPEFKPQGGEDRKSVSSVGYSDEERSHGTMSRTSQSSVKKSKKQKADYWSYRKSPRRHSTTPRSGTGAVNKTQEPTYQVTSPTPSISPRPIRGLIRGPLPKPVKPKPFHHSFRYSEAVEGVIKSIEESKDIDEKTLRRASEILPTLDIQNLREERRRMQEEAKKPSEAEHKELRSPSTDDSDITSGEDLAESSVLSESDDAVARERSMSAPDVLEHDPDSGCGSDGEAEAEWGLKSVLRNFNSAYLAVPTRKTVQFDLPDLAREAPISS